MDLATRVRSQPGDPAEECFYCGVETKVYPFVAGRPVPDDLRTIDHVIPKLMLRGRGLSKKQLLKNRVIACHWCNNKKGGKHPVHRFQAMTEERASRLRDLLYYLGETENVIEPAYFLAQKRRDR